MINYLIYSFIFLFGLAIGSLINVLIYRLPKGEDVVVKPSHCPNCGNRIKPYDLIPVISYIILRGKCRYCGERISIQYPLVELLTAFSFVGIYYKFGWMIAPGIIQIVPFNQFVNLFALMILTAMFIAIFFIDLYHYIIPDEIVIFGLSTGVVLAALKGFQWFVNLSYGSFGFLNVSGYKWDFLKDAGLGLLVGGLTFYIIVIAGEWIMKAEAMGMGDVKLMAVIGLFLGFKLTVLSMFLAFIIGSIVSVFLLIAKIKGRRDHIPFGPFIVLGSTTAFLWGNEIIAWYFNLGRF